MRAAVVAAVVAAAFALAATPEAAHAVDPQAAVRLNKEALSYAYKNELRDALELFQQAHEADDTNAEVVNNLGVTEMRLGMLREAREHFERALFLQPDHQEAVMNLRDLEQYEKPKPVDPAVAALAKSGKPHERKKLPRITLEQLYTDPEYLPMLRGRAPFVLVGAFKGTWATAQSKWKMDYFQREFGERVVDFYPHNMDDEKVRPYLTPMRDVVDELREPSGRFPSDPKHPGTYAQWNVDATVWNKLEGEFGFLPREFTADDSWLYGCLTDFEMVNTYLTSTHWRMLLIGTKGAGMFNHKDTLRTSSYQAQLVGSKRWHLCGPSQDRFVYRAGAVDMFDPDYVKFPLVRNASCYDDVVHAGEFVFYPRDWWHQTINMEELNMAITGTIADANNFDSVQEELTRDCNKDNPSIIPKNPVMCKRLERCYDWWRDAFLGDFVPRAAAKKSARSCPRSEQPVVRRPRAGRR